MGFLSQPGLHDGHVLGLRLTGEPPGSLTVPGNGAQLGKQPFVATGHKLVFPVVQDSLVRWQFADPAAESLL
jgi:hypothetical protein